MYKICLIGTAYPYRGGLAAYTERLAIEFQNKGNKVDIITFSLQYPSFLFPGKTQFSENNAPEDLNIIRKIDTTNPINWFKTGNYINKKKYDIIIFCYWTTFLSPCYGTIAKQIKTAKKIGLIHNMLPHEKSFLDNILPSYFVKKIDGFLAMSNIVLEDIKSFDNKKPKIVSYHPIYDYYGDRISKEEAIKHLSLDLNYKYVLFFGFIRAYKGLDLLIEAFADNYFKHNPIKLIVAGEYYESKKIYESLIDKYGLKNQIILHDHFIKNEEVKYYFSACDLVAQPYKTATQSGVSQIAYHFEKPMIATNVGGLPEMIPHEKAGYIVEPTSNAIAEGIARFFNDDNSDRFISTIKEEKKKYTWETMVNNIVSLYLKIKSNDYKK